MGLLGWLLSGHAAPEPSLGSGPHPSCRQCSCLCSSGQGLLAPEGEQRPGHGARLPARGHFAAAAVAALFLFLHTPVLPNQQNTLVQLSWKLDSVPWAQGTVFPAVCPLESPVLRQEQL